MKKGILAVLIFTLLTGCASSQKAVPTMSEEDYYLVTYRNINNIGIFQFGNEETGMAYFDFATGKVIRIPEKNMKMIRTCILPISVVSLIMIILFIIHIIMKIT